MTEMRKDYKDNGSFMFYEPIHLAKVDNIYYVIDGQHRIVAYDNLFRKNKYPMQQIPCFIWYLKNKDEMHNLFDKINQRTYFDKTKLFIHKIKEITDWMDKNMGNGDLIWGKQRPKINKDKFIDKMRESDTIHKLETIDIITRIKNYNDKIRGLNRTKRHNKTLNNTIHICAETMDFYLGYDKNLDWINEL
jgi:hypothetical protein